MRFGAMIFDLDGTLIDNDKHWHEANKKMFTTLGIPEAMEDKEYLLLVNGRSMLESVHILKERYGLLPSIDELLRLKHSCTDAIYSDLSEPMPGAELILSALRTKPYKMAIASGSPLRRINMIVERFHWHDFFDEIVSVDHVNNVGKPDPAVFSYAALKLSAPPQTCLVFEDAVNGVRAAKAAGMTCVAVTTSDHEDFLLADHKIPSLADSHLYSMLEL